MSRPRHGVAWQHLGKYCNIDDCPHWCHAQDAGIFHGNSLTTSDEAQRRDLRTGWIGR